MTPRPQKLSTDFLLDLLDPLANPLLDLLCVRRLSAAGTLARLVVMGVVLHFRGSVHLVVDVVSTRRGGLLRLDLGVIVRRIAAEWRGGDRSCCRRRRRDLACGQVVGILGLDMLQGFVGLSRVVDGLVELSARCLDGWLAEYVGVGILALGMWHIALCGY